jgi:CheY-like chemotaxis protein
LLLLLLLLLQVATGILARIGVQQVAQAVNGQEALAAVEARGGGDAFDVLLIDLHMPLMGGMEVRVAVVLRFEGLWGSRGP